MFDQNRITVALAGGRIKEVTVQHGLCDGGGKPIVRAYDFVNVRVRPSHPHPYHSSGLDVEVVRQTRVGHDLSHSLVAYVLSVHPSPSIFARPAFPHPFGQIRHERNQLGEGAREGERRGRGGGEAFSHLAARVKYELFSQYSHSHSGGPWDPKISLKPSRRRGGGEGAGG